MKLIGDEKKEIIIIITKKNYWKRNFVFHRKRKAIKKLNRARFIVLIERDRH